VYYPKLEEVKKLKEKGNLVPVYREIVADLETPVSAFLKINRLSFLENATVGGLWLLGEFKDHMISESTYRWLWRNLITALKYEKENMVVNYWQRAYHFIKYNLKHITFKSYRKAWDKVELDRG